MATRVDPRAFLELIQSKGGYDPAGALPVDSQIAKQRIMDVRDRQDDRMGFYDTPVAGGEFAPIVGLLRGISKRNQEKLNDEELSSVYDEFRSVEERRMQAEAQAAAQKAAREKKDKYDFARFEHELKGDTKPEYANIRESADGKLWGLNKKTNTFEVIPSEGYQPKVKPEDVVSPYDAKTESDLRGEFDKATKDFNDLNSAFGRIVASVENPSAAGDLALIFNYMKMLDPGSTVREGEFATAKNAGGVDQRIMASYNALLKGETLSPSQRADFGSRAQRLYTEALKNFDFLKDDYADLASSYERVRPDAVVRDRGQYRGFDFNAPEVGAVEDGYRYIGGPVGSESSWEPVNQ